MKKVFLYLYPIREYTEMFLFYDDKLYDDLDIKRPLPLLNECIQKRYRDNDYQVVFALYPDKEIYGINISDKDKIIYTDVLFKEASAIDENKDIKKDFAPKYPDEKFLLDQLGNVDLLIVGGYHANDCVKKVAEEALNLGIDTLIDLDMTDFFFHLYKQKEYFQIDNYSPQRYKDYLFNKRYADALLEKKFSEMYSSPAYGFEVDNKKTK